MRRPMSPQALAATAGLLLVVVAGAASAQRTITVQPSPDARTAAGAYVSSWAVVIGVNDYFHPRVPKLRYAVNDARAMERALLALGFPRERIVTLLDGSATKAAIEQVLGDDLRGKVGREDRVLVFFAGHGKTDRLRSGEEEGYLIPVDGDPGRLFSTAISMTALRQISDRLPAKHILYVVDACYSGYALYNRAISDDLLEEMVRKPAIQILTAGRQQDQAQERGGHGVFTDVLIRGLRGDAFPGRGWVALEELGLWVKQRVWAESNKKQLPQYGSLSGEGQFVFLRSGARLSVATPPAAAPGTPAPPAEAAPPSSPPAPPPAVAAIPPGRAQVESNPPGADAYWNARLLGKTPIEFPAPAPGRHQLVLVREGYATLIEDVEVTPGQAVRLARRLEEQAGALEIVTKPAGASLELDGVPVGASPQKLARVKVGKHRLKVTHRDHLDLEREVAVEFEQTARVDVELAPKPARLLVTSTPAQAEVWVGGKRLGVTVWAGELPPGRHQVRVAKDGYEDRLFDMDVGPNEAKSLDARLKKWDLGEMVLVPAGEFWMGSAAPPEGFLDERPRHRVYLDAFYIDKYEVTNVQFKAFMDARGYERQEFWSADGWRWRLRERATEPAYWGDAKWNGARQPVVGVSWYEAEAFCRFAGKRLPTEAEWEKAARGADGRRYPWGDAWESSRANSAESNLGKTVPVGSYSTGTGPYGAHDMAGNVWEWVADWYASDYYRESPERDPRGPTTGPGRVLRGGSWYYGPIVLRTANRSNNTPGHRIDHVGCRCARGLP